MKRVLLLLLLFHVYLICFSQPESEPNNTFGTANTRVAGSSVSAIVGGADAIDNFRAQFVNNANFQVIIQATNTSGSGSHTLTVSVYNGLTFPGPVLSPQLEYMQTVSLAPIPAGQTKYDTITVCGLAPDNYYITFTSSGTFSYTFKWLPVNTAVIDGDNNTMGTARLFTSNLLKEGSLRYEIWGNTNFDSTNYFKSFLPAGSYATKRLFLNARFNGCFGNGWIKYFCYRNDSPTPFASGFIGNDSTVTTTGFPQHPAYQQVNNSISLSNMVAGDSLFVKFTASGAFSYSMIYQEPGGFIDNEDNCCVYNAIALEENVLTGGNVGTYDFGNDVYLDEFDTYSFVMPHYGSITVQATASNAECTEELYSLDVALLDSAGNEVGAYPQIAFWTDDPSCNQQQTKTFTIGGLTARKYHLRLYTGYPGKINYTLQYSVTDSTTRFDAEPNGTTATAIPLAPGEVKKGNVKFWGAGDANDYYRVVVPADGKLTVNLTSVFLGTEEIGNSNFSKLQLEIVERLTSLYCPGGTPSILVPGTTYTNNGQVVCAVGAGTYYFRVTAGFGTPHEYEISYQFTDTSSVDNDLEPNNTKPQAILMGGGQTKKGHLYYYYNGATDNDDYYKFVFGSTDSLVLFVNATNTSCTAGRRIRISGVNKNSVSVFNRYIANNTSVADGQTIYDTVRLKITGPDTIYVRFFDDVNTGSFKYQLTSKILPPYSVFSLKGDTAVCVSTQAYNAINIPEDNVTYHWSLPDGGGTFTFVDSVITVNWTTEGNRRIQLYLTNAAGTSLTKTLNVIVNGVFPTQIPVAYNFARTLSTNSLPPGATCQWYRNDTLIAGATNTSYYAAAAGSFTVKFVNDCGAGPASNAIVFPAAAQAQTITFPHVSTVSMSPTAKVGLQATSSSELPVFYQKISGPGNIINDTLFITGAGTIIVKASQPGDDVYSAAPTVNDTITVVKGDQVITFDNIPDHIFDANKITLIAASSMGQGITYSIIAGTAYASVSSNKITKKGAGTVTVRASQNGNGNYNAAAPVERTFCIGVRTLTPITGDAAPCLATYRYNTQKIPGAIFVWTLSGGGTLTTNNDTAWVQWQTPGTYTLTVKANSPCDPIYTTVQSYTVTTSNNIPGAVSNMLPANNAADRQLPLTLSWIPGNNTVNYDLYLWDSTATEPLTPYVANISDIQYIIPKNSGLPYNKTYKWKIVSKNPCWQTTGPVQQFRLIPLPDLVVSDVQAPATATSGQTISISWKVTNVGPGRTGADATWYDGVYFALDTVPNVSFSGSPNWNPSSWNSLTANGRPLLLGKKLRPSSLDSGQFYTNTLDFTLPIQYSFPVYIYVITDNEHPNWKILQVSVANDTARKQNAMNITLAPTPDLRVDSIFAPASTFSGSTVNLTYKVKNFGVATQVSSSWTDSVFISQNPLFDRNVSIPLNLPKFNDSYYPNAAKATAYNDSVQILPNGSITKNLQVVIPNYIFGAWFIYVKTNASTTAPFVYEGALSNNNLNQAQVQVYLTPTPKLTVNTLTVPVTSASTTQPVGANWVIKNEGFRDNMERNRGHYITMSSCYVPCPPGSPPNSICTGPSVIKDSIAFGSSYWLDRTYLSTDSTGLNIANAVLVKETTHGTLNSGLYFDRFPNYLSCPAVVFGHINVSNIINPGSDFPVATSFAMPDTLQPGNYYMYVYTNPTKTVFEYPGTAQIKRSALPITVVRPDATVPSVTVPSSVSGGQQLTINYTVMNNGPGAVFSHIRRDRIYTSNFSSFDGSAQLIDTKIYTEDMPVGTSIPHSLTYAFPPATTGARYFYVITNYDSAFRETNSLNNISAAVMTTVSAALPADLVVTNIQMPDTTFSIFTQFLTYTVTNNGTGTTAGTWTDSVYFSCSPAFNISTNNFAAKKTQIRAVPPGGSYTDTIHITIPKMSYEINTCFPQTANQSAYFFMKTNATLSIYEGTAINNNVTGTGSKIFTNPLVDQVVTSVSAPDTTKVGFLFPANWRVKNIGYNPNKIQYYYSWFDAIYFSADSVADAADVLAGEYLKYLRINRGQDSADARSPYTPNLLTGDYYVYVKTNSHGGINAEKVLTNNVNFIRNGSGAAKKIHVIRPLLADLTDTILSAPVTVALGQPITVIYKVTNSGTGLTYPGSSWPNRVLLSEDFTALPNDGDRLLATRTRLTPLSPGEYYNDTATVTIPTSTIPGNYILISQANSNNTVVELNGSNNLGFSLLSVYAPPVTDLIVDKVLKPDTVYLGYTMDTAKWVVKNTSGEQARGYSSDGIYLSAGNLLDSTAVLLGVKNKNINMQPLQSDTVRMAPLVTGVVEGNYNVFVKTDLLNNILETDKENNTGVSATPIYVKVKKLLLNVPEVNTLHTINRYYKLRVPDSLLGSTILVTLKTNDSLIMKNEMFIGGSFVPTAAHYDYRFEIPNYGNQQIVIASVTDTVYYIMYRCVSPNPVIQNVTLKAVKLPFAILSVHTNSGGNIGNVTVKINGSLFRDSMVAKLSKPGTTIYSSAVYFTNSTQVFATFNLQGRPLGVYDITLVKPDSSTAVLPNGFAVVPANNGGLITGGGINTGSGNGNAPGCDPGAASGLNSQLVVQLVIPSRVLLKRPIVILINYSNPTNFDIPAQSRILYSEAGLKMAFTKEGVPTGTTSLYLELTEPGGPPGIIRAGASGTIIVHSRAADQIPDPNPVTWKLK